MGKTEVRWQQQWVASKIGDGQDSFLKFTIKPKDQIYFYIHILKKQNFREKRQYISPPKTI